MTRRRVLIATFVVSTVAAFAVTPLAANGAPRPGHGTASTSLNLIDVAVQEMPQVGSTGASLGTAGAEATTIDDPSARVILDALSVAGQSLASHEVSSDDGIASESAAIPISAPGIDGSVTAAELRAEATPQSAAGMLRALTGTLDVGPLGLSARVGENGMRAEVMTKQASSRTGASFGPVELSVGDLLPRALLDGLPLSTVIDLTQGLGIDLGMLGEQVQSLRRLIALLDQVQAVVNDLAKARDDLLDLVGGNAALLDQIDAAQQQVQAAEAAVAAVRAEVDALQAQLTELTQDKSAVENEIAALQAQKTQLENELGLCATPVVCTTLQTTLDQVTAQIATLDAQKVAIEAEIVRVQGEVTAKQAELDAAIAQLSAAQATLASLLAGVSQQAIDALQNTVDDLQPQLTSLLNQLQSLLNSLPDLSQVRNQLVGLLADTPLLGIGQITVAANASADSRRGTAAVHCEAAGVQIAGQQIGAMSCDALNDRFGQLEAAIREVLKSLPGGSALPSVTAEGLRASTRASDRPDSTGTTTAESSLSALHVAIPSVSLDAVVDALVQDLLGEINDVTSLLPAGTTVASLLNRLKAELDSLPTGQALAGLRTVGIEATVLGVVSRASFTATPRTPETPNPHTPPPFDPEGDAPPPVDQPEQRGPTPQLPFTGDPTALVLALALWLIAAGSLFMFFTDHRLVLRVEPRPDSLTG